MSAILNRITKCVAKININRPLGTKIENEIMHCLNKIRPYRLQGIIVVINSNGGSLTTAKNITEALHKIREEKQIPIYGFAEDYCLNSANLILTSCTQCYANKFTILGDFGYLYDTVDITKAR